jgi:hypothetical protein
LHGNTAGEDPGDTVELVPRFFIVEIALDDGEIERERAVAHPHEVFLQGVRAFAKCLVRGLERQAAECSPRGEAVEIVLWLPGEREVLDGRESQRHDPASLTLLRPVDKPLSSPRRRRAVPI